MKHKPKTTHPKNKDDFMSKHHCYPTGRMKSKDAPKTDYPTLTIRLWRSRHDLWHNAFRCLTIDEIIWQLQFRPTLYTYNKAYNKLFNCKPIIASRILRRFKQIKTRNVMKDSDALKVAHEVQHAIKDLDHLYVVIVIKENREREVRVKLKNGGHYGN